MDKIAASSKVKSNAFSRCSGDGMVFLCLLLAITRYIEGKAFLEKRTIFVKL